jgi:hypothetical protein
MEDADVHGERKLDEDVGSPVPEEGLQEQSCLGNNRIASAIEALEVGQEQMQDGDSPYGVEMGRIFGIKVNVKQATTREPTVGGGLMGEVIFPTAQRYGVPAIDISSDRG